MYKKILVPTDGTKLSQRAVEHAIGLARATGAAVVVLHAYPKFLGSPYGTVGPAAEVLAEAHERQTRAETEALLLGSDTQKMLTHSTLPVLVLR